MSKKDPKYPLTPMRNCMYCFWFNKGAVSCDNPKAVQIASFHQNADRDCILLSYEKSENPDIPNKPFAEKFCIGKKCPYYFASKRLCTRPTLCPYKDEEVSLFSNIQLKSDEEETND